MKARDQTSFWCEFTNNETGKTAAGYGPAARYGDSCPADTEYNKETGECKENKCKILAGSLYEKSHQAPISRFINYLGCEIAVSAIDGCIGPAEGQAGATYCKVIGSFTGNWFTSNGSCAFGCDVGPGDGPPPGGDGGTGAMVAATRPAATVEATAAPSPVAATTAPVAAVEEVAAAVATLPTAMAMGMAIAAAMVTVLVPTAALVAMAATAPAGRPERAEARFLRQDHQGIRRRHAKAQKDFQELQGKFESVLASKFDIHLGTGGGSCRVGTLPPSANASTSV